MPRSNSKNASPESSRSRILDAALRCIEQKGLTATTMEDIAAEAGLVRKTLYLAFGNRSALLDAILMQRLGKNVDRLRRYVATFRTLDEAIVKGCVKHLRLVRKDGIMISLMENTHGIELERYLVAAKSPTAKLMMSIWEDALDNARARGELRPDLSNTEITDWLRGVTNTLLKRDDLSTRGQEDLLRKFVLPALKPPAS